MSTAALNEAAHLRSKTTVGFWIYLMTDCILFAALFATFAVLRDNTSGGPSGDQLFSLPYVLAETLILLTSSFACGLGLIAAYRRDLKQLWLWFGLTFMLGLAFLGLELHEFSRLVADGDSWQRSGFLSAFFTLVGTHGAHISAGLTWLAVMGRQIWQRGLSDTTLRRLTLFSLFWHFLDLVWIFIFSVVYLVGAL